MRELILYTTMGCHLCERAKEIIWPQLELYSYRLVELDIATDSALVESYGVRIPVVKRADSVQDLGWPFDAEQLSVYLADNVSG